MAGEKHGYGVLTTGLPDGADSPWPLEPVCKLSIGHRTAIRNGSEALPNLLLKRRTYAKIQLDNEADPLPLKVLGELLCGPQKMELGTGRTPQAHLFEASAILPFGVRKIDPTESQGRSGQKQGPHWAFEPAAGEKGTLGCSRHIFSPWLPLAPEPPEMSG